jgi:hypothetical protein
MNFLINTVTAILLLQGLQVYAAAIPQSLQENKPVLYKNKAYRFSFLLPADWKKQTGDVNGNHVLFMPLPLNQSCSFQFNITPMPATFPAEMVVDAGLKAALLQVKQKKLFSAQRRDAVHDEKVLTTEKGKEVESIKPVTFIRGWEIGENPQQTGLQRLVYQAYNKSNAYFNFIATASYENFAQCHPQLQQIMASIQFAP